MTDADILQYVYAHLGSERDSGIVKPMVLAMAGLTYLDLAKILIDTEPELAKKLTKTLSNQAYSSSQFAVPSDMLVYKQRDTIRIDFGGTLAFEIKDRDKLSLLASGLTNTYYALEGKTFFFKNPLDLGVNSVIVSGSNSSAANGTYTLTGTSNGKSFWNKAGTNAAVSAIAWDNISGQWRIWDNLGNIAYSSVSTSASPANLAYIAVFSSAPLPTVTAISHGNNLNITYYKVPVAADIDAEIRNLFLQLLMARLTISLPQAKDTDKNGKQ